MKWSSLFGSLVLGLAVCTTGYSFELLDMMLGSSGCGCESSCCETKCCKSRCHRSRGCGCNDGKVLCTAVACPPVVCALFLEQPDGVCRRFPLDPCITQDPDCTQGSEPTVP